MISVKSISNRVTLSWCLYDWGNSAFATSVMACFFPLFFKEFWSVDSSAVETTARLGFANSIATALAGCSAPFLGMLAKSASQKRCLLLIFALGGALFTSMLFFIAEGYWLAAACLYILASIGFFGGNIFYDALLPDVTDAKNFNIVSSMGYSAGYLGGAIVLALNVFMTLKPDWFGITSTSLAVRYVFLSVGIWWVVFSFPVFFISSSPVTHKKSIATRSNPDVIRQLRKTLITLLSQKNIRLFLVAYWLYIDGVNTIIKMAVDFGISIGLPSKDLVVALLFTQLVGFPAALGFGFIAGKIGTKAAILSGLIVYCAVTVWGSVMTTSLEFYILAAVIGLIQGGVQALSRSHFATIIPSEESTEYFGFYNMIGKFTGLLGPLLMGVSGLGFHYLGLSESLSSRLSILSVTCLFIAGGMLLISHNRSPK